jgi:hypothetical protein
MEEYSHNRIKNFKRVNHSRISNAYDMWQRHAPLNNQCCTSQHVTTFTNCWKPDDQVCDRELAWRRYVRLRDGDPLFPQDIPAVEITETGSKVWHDGWVNHGYSQPPSEVSVSLELEAAILERKRRTTQGDNDE